MQKVNNRKEKIKIILLAGKKIQEEKRREEKRREGKGREEKRREEKRREEKRREEKIGRASCRERV